MRQIFLTFRAEPLPRWIEAFPEAEVFKYEQLSGRPISQLRGAVIWVHIERDDTYTAERIQKALSLAPGCPIVVISNRPSEQEGLAALQMGVSGYCHALAVAEMLQQVAQVVENGGLWVGPDLMQRLISSLARLAPRGQATRLDSLSPREREVAYAVARGETNKEIARKMDITERTVKAHLTTIFEKLEVRDRLQLSLLVNGMPAAHG